jgi:hypothetical protein
MQTQGIIICVVRIEYLSIIQDKCILQRTKCDFKATRSLRERPFHLQYASQLSVVTVQTNPQFEHKC